MTESNPQMNVLFDGSFRLLDCNPAALGFMGIASKDELLAMYPKREGKALPSMPNLTLAAAAPTMLVDRLITAAKAGLTKFKIEIIMDGRLRNLDVEFRRIPYGEGQVIIAYIYDMTEMRERETELIRARNTNELQLAKLSLMVKASRIGLWDMDLPQGDPLRATNPFNYSAEYRSMLGYAGEDDFPGVIGSWIGILHDEDRQRTLDAFRRHLADKSGKTPYDVEYRLKKSCGEYAYYRTAGETIRDQEGNAVRIAGSLADITETKNIILDSERQRIEAEAANKAKSSFLSTMSHEIRTPMNAIIGMTAIGRKAQDIKKAKDAFEKIDGASKHLLGVINDVLDISKIEADKFDLSPIPFDFEKMLQKVSDVIGFKVDERQQRFNINIGKDMPRILIGDDQRISQVITNLLSNAVKFTPEEGTITLETRLLTEYDGACKIMVSVEDSGIGITDEQKARLFRKFEQAEAGTSRKFGGTGLGLAISKRIVELMGGEIWVESEPGKGSRFSFTATLRRGSPDKIMLLPEGVNWKNIRIFVVDDDPVVREFFTALSEVWGVACTVASSGEEAAKRLETEMGHDIYFIDWNLPGMNGGELAQRIREKTSDRLLVIITSSLDRYIIEDDARMAGVDKFLAKPLFPSMLVDMINECIGFENAVEREDKPDVRDDFTGHTLLLAEDVEINREIVLALLDPTGVKVECAENGARAVDMFMADPDRYGMVFMDVQMPEMDGHEATRAIRSLGFPWAKEVPIIAMTANVFRDDIEECLAAGMDDHVGKPLDFDDVLGMLRTYLK